MKDWHHYCQTNEVATQFCTFEWPKFKAAPNENYSRSFSKLAIVAASDPESAVGLRRQCIYVEVSYPVVVFQGPIYRVEDHNDKARLEATDHLQLHHAATVNGNVIQTQIDVVTEAAFPKVMEKILEELKTLRERINGMYARLLNSAVEQKRVALERAVIQNLPTSFDA